MELRFYNNLGISIYMGAHSQGFTLIELMLALAAVVALTIILFVLCLCEIGGGRCSLFREDCRRGRGGEEHLARRGSVPLDEGLVASTCNTAQGVATMAFITN